MATTTKIEEVIKDYLGVCAEEISFRIAFHKSYILII